VTADPAREKYLARHRRYNTSRKGQARNQRYEESHPERQNRWEPQRPYGERRPPGQETS